MKNIFMSQIQAQFLGVELYFENLESETLNLMLSDAQPQNPKDFLSAPCDFSANSADRSD
jgi:hypothetical protein